MFADPLQTSHTCHRFWNCYKANTFSSICKGAESYAPGTKNDAWTSKSRSNVVYFYRFDFEMCSAPSHRALPFRHLNTQKRSQTPTFFRLLTRDPASGHNGTAQLPKLLQTWSTVKILTSKRVSRLSVHSLLDISTSTSASTMRCFYNFDFHLCFSPQACALYLFQELSCQNCSGSEVLLAFWLPNLLRATLALHTCHFREPICRPSGVTKHWKNTSVSRLWYLFWLFLFSNSSQHCWVCP